MFIDSSEKCLDLVDKHERYQQTVNGQRFHQCERDKQGGTNLSCRLSADVYAMASIAALEVMPCAIAWVMVATAMVAPLLMLCSYISSLMIA